MITFIEGELVEKEPARLVISAGGIGYEVFIPLSSYDRFPPSGATCRVLTWLCVREDAHILYGFATPEEREWFLLLMTVSGIGPKIALNALSGLSVRELTSAIAVSDVKRISSVSGIGKKTAERIVVELKDKVSGGKALEALAGADAQSGGDVRVRDAMLALIALGYKQVDAQAAVRGVMPSIRPDDPVENIVRKALAATVGK